MLVLQDCVEKLPDPIAPDDDTIAQVLGVKSASLRTLRSRIKGREK